MNGSSVGTTALDWIANADPLHVAVRASLRKDRLGYSPDDSYVETFWLPILGPSSVLALRRLHHWLNSSPGEALALRSVILSECLGLGHGAGRRASIVRTLGRLVDFQLATIDNDCYLLGDTVPLLSPRLLRRLPPGLLAAHEQLIQGSTRGIGQACSAPLFVPVPAGVRTGPRPSRMQQLDR